MWNELKEKIANKTLKIGWIGTGVMGSSMCEHIMSAGYGVSLFTRTQEKASNLLEKGAKWNRNPFELAQSVDILFSIVGYPSDVEEIYLGEQGALPGLKTGAIAIDLTTSQPSLAKRLADRGQETGVSFLDAPVSGGDVGAKNGTLSIMVGGDEEAFQVVLPLLDCFGKNIVYQGSAGSGQHTKMCNQTVIAGTMIGMCEAMIYGIQAGLDLNSVLKSISSGAAGCWSLDNLAARVLKDDFEPGFFVEHFLKDLNIALQESQSLGLKLPGLKLATDLYHKTHEMGYAKKGTQALFLALKEISKGE